jgi:hypothetical protein
MVFIVIVEILVSTGLWFAVFWASQRRFINPFFDWHSLGVVAVTFSQLLMLAVVTALWDFQRSIRWFLILAILLAQTVLLSPLMVITTPGFHISQLETIFAPQVLVGLAAILGVILTIGVASVLFLHVLLWPVRNMLGWRVHWVGETIPPVKPQFTLWHLFVWTALIGALLSLGRTLAEFNSWAGMTTFLLLWAFAALLAGFPAFIVATRRRGMLLWLAASIVWLVTLSFAESELTFILTRTSGARSWLPLWLLLICNGIVAIAVVLHVLLLRWLGMVFDLRLPFSRTDKTLVAYPVTGTVSLEDRM